MKGVLFYCNYSAPYAGNFICSLTALNNELQVLGIKTVFVFPIESRDCNWIDDLRKHCDCISFNDMQKLSDAVAFNQLLVDYKIDIVHTHFVWSRFFFTANFALYLHPKIKCFVHVHNHCWEEKSILTRISRHLILNGKHFVGCGPSVAESVIERGYPKSRTYSLENAIDFRRLDVFQPISLGKGAEYKCLIYGFDYKRKGVDIAIHAIQELRVKGKKIELYIPISKNPENTIEQIKEEFEEVPNWVHILAPRNDIATYYHACNVFLTPSREEGFCYAAVEAYYCGVPVISSDIPGPREINLSKIKWIKNESIEELTIALEGILEQTCESEEQKKEAEERFGLQPWVEKMIDIYGKS